MAKYANEICYDCAMKAGWIPNNEDFTSTYWFGVCDACGEEKGVTSIRDFEYIKIRKGEFKE